MKYLFLIANVVVLLANMAMPAWSSLIVERFDLAPRTALTSFPVPAFRPTQPGQVIGIDAFPSAGAVANADNGYAWFDACDTDIMDATGSTPVACARMGIKPDRVEFGSRNFDGAPEKDIYIIRNRQVVAKFDAGGLTVYGTVKATGGFSTVP